MSDDLLINVTPWMHDDTQKWLSLNPLPVEFMWPHRDLRLDGSENIQAVLPSYRLSKGYGFWLRTTPYFPGLFEEIHAVLLSLGDELPSAEQMAQLLQSRRMAAGKQQTLFSK